jgi:hypothetical protein
MMFLGSLSAWTRYGFDFDRSKKDKDLISDEYIPVADERIQIKLSCSDKT